VTFAERLKELMVENGITNYQLSKDTGTHATTIANWLDKNKNAIPQERKFKAIADYFGVSVEYLKGETDIKEKAAPLSESDLSEKEIQFLEIFRQLSVEEQDLFLKMFRAKQE
jgi:transcriptional regulator with XRE-family HTH domain